MSVDDGRERAGQPLETATEEKESAITSESGVALLLPLLSDQIRPGRYNEIAMVEIEQQQQQQKQIKRKVQNKLCYRGALL